MKPRTPRMPRRRPASFRIGLVTAVAALLGVLTAGPALAHTRLVDSTPGKGESAAGVTEVTLVFSSEISNPQIVVRNADGKTFQQGEPEVSGDTVTQPLKGELPAGEYTVAYRVVGGDGHPVTSEELTFTATAGGPGAVITQTATPSETLVSKKTAPAAAAEDEESGSGAVAWVVICVGVLIGVGIGMLIVRRATRKHTRDQAKAGRDE